MSFKLRNKEPLHKGIGRVAHEQSQSIRDSVGEDRKRHQGEAVHNARKSIKKMRALLRLIAADLGKRTFQRENRAYRDMGRKLSPLRDATVLIASVEKLRDQYCKQVAPNVFVTARNALKNPEKNGAKNLAAVRNQLNKSLAEATRRIDSWPLDKVDWNDLYLGLERIYRQGRRACTAASRDPGMANLHEWRKRVKDLWYHLRLLNPVWPEVMNHLAEEIKILSEYLGEDHDFAVLEETLSAKRLRKSDWNILCLMIKARRSQLQRAAFDLGSRVYAEKPKGFARRIERYWRAWHTKSKIRSAAKN